MYAFIVIQIFLNKSSKTEETHSTSSQYMENSNSSGKRDRSGNRNKRNSGISRKNGKNAWLEHKLNRHNKATNSSGVIERHKGSYNLDALKETASYVSQMAYLNALYPPERMESSVNENSAETK